MKIIDVKEKLTEIQLNEISSVLLNGGIIIYPTETCYGVGALCTSEKGVNKLIGYKQRPEGKAISVAVTDRKMAEEYVVINQTADNIYTNFLPGPVTVISKSKGTVIKKLESELSTLGIRIPNHKIPLQIIEKMGEGITATSANISGGKTPYKISDILDSISKNKVQKIDLIIDYGVLPKRPSSIVIDTTQENPVILRGEDSLGLLSKENELIEEWTSKTEKDTEKIAENVWEIVKPDKKGRGVALFLSGELGAGKTHFVKGLAKALGVKENVVSPTFIFERQYDLKNQGVERLYHYDLWRLEQPIIENTPVKELLDDLGVSDAASRANIIAVEWPEKIQNIKHGFRNFNYSVYFITVTYLSENQRQFRLYKTN